MSSPPATTDLPSGDKLALATGFSNLTDARLVRVGPSSTLT